MIRDYKILSLKKESSERLIPPDPLSSVCFSWTRDKKGRKIYTQSPQLQSWCMIKQCEHHLDVRNYLSHPTFAPIIHLERPE